MTDGPATPQEKANEPWRLLGTLPSTNWKTASGTVVLFATTAVVLGVIVRIAGDPKRDATLISLVDSWEFFVGTAVLSVTAAQYIGKRLTFKQGGPDDKRSDVASVAAPDAEVIAVAPAPAQPVPDLAKIPAPEKGP